MIHFSSSRNARLLALLLAGVCLCLSARADTVAVHTAGHLSLATLNLAHGRGTSINQMLTGKGQIRDNLERIGLLLRDRAVDVLALQEADQASLWSGRFDHVDFLAQSGAYPHAVAGAHASSFLFSYGTALLSRVPMEDTASHAFAPSPPTLTKGYVRGRINWNPNNRLSEPLRLMLVSLHLDFSRPSVRRAQIRELIDELSDRDEMLVLMGDFNSKGEGPDSLIQQLCAALNLKAYPGGESTYLGRAGGRLDWILIPERLDFLEHFTWEETLSDHRLVLARVTLPPLEQER